MKIICAADLHIRGNKTAHRKDNYLEAQWKKLEFMVDYANKKHAKIMLIAGDIFDAPTTAYSILAKTIEIFTPYKGIIVMVYGQHDLIFHNYSTRENTPLNILSKMPNCCIASSTPIQVYGKKIVGVSWGQKVPNEECDICLIHKLITKRKDSRLKNSITARTLKSLIGCKAGLYVTGDNHITFTYQNIINPGSMMRLKTDQIDHRPCFFLVNGNEYQKIYSPIKKDVFEVVDKEPDTKSKITEKFLKELKNIHQDNPDFESKLIAVRDKIRNRHIKKEIDAILLEAKEGL